jgi:hypothetical protein
MLHSFSSLRSGVGSRKRAAASINLLPLFQLGDLVGADRFRLHEQSMPGYIEVKSLSFRERI